MPPKPRKENSGGSNMPKPRREKWPGEIEDGRQYNPMDGNWNTITSDPD